MTLPPQNEEVAERIKVMTEEMRKATLGEALDKGFYLRIKPNGELWLCLGQWILQRVEVEK